MIIGLNDDESRTLNFGTHTKIVSKEQYLQLLRGHTGILTPDEYQAFHFNVEAKRTGDVNALTQINREILHLSQRGVSL